MSELFEIIKEKLPYLENALIDKMIEKSSDVTLPPNQQILREGQYIKRNITLLYTTLRKLCNVICIQHVR